MTDPLRNSNPGSADVWYTPDCGHVHLSTDGTIYAVCPEGVTLIREPGLDVERLARALFQVTVDEPGLLSDVDMLNDPRLGDPTQAARAIAREYAALASEDRP